MLTYLLERESDISTKTNPMTKARFEASLPHRGNEDLENIMKRRKHNQFSYTYNPTNRKKEKHGVDVRSDFLKGLKKEIKSEPILPLLSSIIDTKGKILPEHLRKVYQKELKENLENAKIMLWIFN